MFKSGTFLNIYINTLNLPSEVKRELMDSNPKTISDVSLWLEQNAFTEPRKTGFPSLEFIKNAELFSPNGESVQFLRYSDGGHFVDTDEASWGLAVERTSQAAEVELCSSSAKNTGTSNARKTDSTVRTEKEYVEEQQDKAISTIRENADQALKVVSNQKDSQGKVSKHYNSAKEYFNAEMAYSNVCRVLFAEKTTADILEKAQSGQLTVAEYWNLKIDEVIEMLTAGRELSDGDREALKDVLLNFTPKDLNKFIDRVKSCDNAEYAKIAANVDKMIQEGKSRSSEMGYREAGTSSSIKAIIEGSGANGSEIMTFEKAYLAERGVEFKPEKIAKYEEASAKYTMAVVLSNRVESMHKALDSDIALVKGNSAHGVDDKTRKIGMQKLEVSLLTTLSDLYGDDEEQIAKELESLSGGALSYENGKIVQDGGLSDYALYTAAEKLIEKTESNLTKLMDGKSIEDFQDSMASTYEAAYGRKNAQQLAKAFEKDQEESTGKVRTGVEIAGGAIMAAGMMFFPPATYVGAIISSAGGIAVEAYNEGSRKDGMSKETKVKLLSELATNAALFATGAGAGKIGSMAKAALLAKNCPTLAACVADIGVDATISLLGDFVLTGQIDIKGEGLSQLLSLVAGHVRKVRGSKGKKMPQTTSHDINTNVSNCKTSNDIHSVLKSIADNTKYSDNELKEISKKLIKIKQKYPDKYKEMVDSGLFELIKNKRIDFSILEKISDKNVISKDFLEDCRKVSKNIPYVKDYPETTSLSDVAKTTPNGEVACIGKTLYVNKNGKMIKLSLTKEKYQELFPALDRFNIMQNESKYAGNCWFLASLDNLNKNKSTRADLLSLFRQEGNDIYVKLPNEDVEFKFSEGNVPKAGNNILSSSCKGINMLEYAAAFVRKNDNMSALYLEYMDKQTKIVDMNNLTSINTNFSYFAALNRLYGGNYTEAMKILLGNNKTTEKILNYNSDLTPNKQQKQEIEKLLKDYLKNPKGILNIALGNHAYNVIRIEGDKFFISDPYDTKFEQVLTLNEIINGGLLRGVFITKIG